MTSRTSTGQSVYDLEKTQAFTPDRLPSDPKLREACIGGEPTEYYYEAEDGTRLRAHIENPNTLMATANAKSRRFIDFLDYPGVVVSDGTMSWTKDRKAWLKYWKRGMEAPRGSTMIHQIYKFEYFGLQGTVDIISNDYNRINAGHKLSFQSADDLMLMRCMATLKSSSPLVRHGRKAFEEGKTDFQVPNLRNVTVHLHIDRDVMWG